MARDLLSRLLLLRVSHHASTRLSQPDLFLPRRGKLSPSASSHSRTGLSLRVRIYSSLRYPLVTSQVQPRACYDRGGTSSHSDRAALELLAAPSPIMDCITSTLVNKGFRYITNVSLAHTYQQPPLPVRSYGPWHGHCPRDTLVHGRSAILSLIGGIRHPPREI
jgi:hypothetical protein